MYWLGQINDCCYVLMSISGTRHDSQYTQRRVQPDQCYFTVQITDSNFFSAICSVIQQS